MALKPGGAKQKGAEGEREAAALLQRWAKEVGYDIDPTRNLEQTRGGGYDLNGVPGLGVEVKRVETPAITQWWKQCTRQADDDGTVPFLMHRQNRKPWSFRVRTYVAYYGKTSGTALLDVDLTLDQARLWFQAYLNHHLGEN